MACGVGQHLLLLDAFVATMVHLDESHEYAVVDQHLNVHCGASSNVGD
jgi:hypothetical protein